MILACELDSGKERRFTPETDPELPVRVAVRMSMGVPGLMEPFSYGGCSLKLLPLKTIEMLVLKLPTLKIIGT